MNKGKFLVMAAIAATMTIVSCSNEDTVRRNDNRVQVKLSSNVITPVQTRVSGDQWEGNENIGVYMVENATTSIAESAANINYSTASTGNSATFTAVTTPIYYPVTAPDKVDFIAYYPYQSTIADWTYKVDVSKQDVLSKIDLMWAKANNSNNGYDKLQTGTVNLPFSHQLSKLELVAEAGEGISDLTGLTVSIKGMNTVADFDLKTAKLSNLTSSQDITPKVSGSFKYESILLPVTLNANHKVVFTLNGNTYTWNMTNNINNITELKSANKYSYKVTINKHGIELAGTIADWTLGDNSNVNAD